MAADRRLLRSAATASGSILAGTSGRRSSPLAVCARVVALLEVAILAAPSARGGEFWREDFGSYAAGEWPGPTWVAEGNAASDPARNQVAADPLGSGNNVLALYGLTNVCGVANAYRACAFPPSFTLEFRVRNGAETTAPCQPFRGRVLMQKTASLASPFRELISFTAGGAIWLGGITNPVGVYTTNAWHHVRIRYDRIGSVATILGWMDGVFLGQVARTNAHGDASLEYLRLMAASGFVWYDDIRVSVPAPAIAASAAGIGLTFEEPTGTVLAIEYAADLADPVWVGLTNLVIESIPQTIFHDDIATNGPRVYRAFPAGNP